MLDVNQTFLKKICAIAQLASRQIMEIYQRPCDFLTKSDGSPVTEADLVSHHLITQKLEALCPGIVIVSEENTDIDEIQGAPLSQFWLVDPLDGTKEFIQRNGEFTVNIALIEAGQPILGVVSAPALGVLYAGICGLGAFKIDEAGVQQSLHATCAQKDKFYVLGSRSHGNQPMFEAYLANYPTANFSPMGSSLKFCMIAEGRAHVYPRFGPTMEWDTAAGQAVLTASGGEVKVLGDASVGKMLSYGKSGFKNPHFIAQSQGL
jgi:3'(2'), 5'-bisphosphate nucleotidase